MSYVCAYSSVQLDKSRVEKEFTFDTADVYRSMNAPTEFAFVRRSKLLCVNSVYSYSSPSWGVIPSESINLVVRKVISTLACKINYSMVEMGSNQLSVQLQITSHTSLIPGKNDPLGNWEISRRTLPDLSAFGLYARYSCDIKLLWTTAYGANGCKA